MRLWGILRRVSGLRIRVRRSSGVVGLAYWTMRSMPGNRRGLVRLEQTSLGHTVVWDLWMEH